MMRWALAGALALAAGAAWAGEPGPTATASAREGGASESVAGAPEGGKASGAARPALAGDAVVDAILPCGLRVLAARDATLPVAAVILAVESGAEDDPAELPGLVHALAYHAQQGNRELRPGEAVELVHGGGGVATMAVGLGQVRFESVVPASRLMAALEVESQRLRAPRTAASAWKTTLGWASQDPPRAALLRPEAVAAVHHVPALAHDPRAVGEGLRALNEGAVASHMRARMDYARATLVVVGPGDPREVVRAASGLFADLPAAPRRAPARPLWTRPSDGSSPVVASSSEVKPSGEAAGAATPAGATPASASASAGGGAPPATPSAAAYREPEVAAVGSGRAPVVAWPIAGTPAASLRAQAICRALNRQRRVDAEERAIKVACAIDLDARRAVMLVQVTGVEAPVAALWGRLERLRERDAGLLAAQAAAVAADHRYYRRTPLEAARQLAAVAEREAGVSEVVSDLDALTGVAAVLEAQPLVRVDDAVVLVRSENSPKPLPAGAGKPAQGKPAPTSAEGEG